jgi:hypothetical protein
MLVLTVVIERCFMADLPMHLGCARLWLRTDSGSVHPAAGAD